MKRLLRMGIPVLMLALLATPLVSNRAVIAQGGGSTTAVGVTFFGSLFNFDVYNDTGEVANGFEIEVDGVQDPPIEFFPNRYETQA